MSGEKSYILSFTYYQKSNEFFKLMWRCKDNPKIIFGQKQILDDFRGNSYLPCTLVKIEILGNGNYITFTFWSLRAREGSSWQGLNLIDVDVDTNLLNSTIIDQARNNQKITWFDPQINISLPQALRKKTLILEKGRIYLIYKCDSKFCYICVCDCLGNKFQESK